MSIQQPDCYINKHMLQYGIDYIENSVQYRTAIIRINDLVAVRLPLRLLGTGIGDQFVLE